MRITHYRSLNRDEVYLSTKKEVKKHFSDIEGLTAVFGLNRKYEVDSRCSKKLDTLHSILISITCNREKEMGLSLFPFMRSDLSSEMLNQFEEIVLPTIKEWFVIQAAKPDTAVNGIEELVFSWDGRKYRKQSLTYL
ncbi:hypothetical protein [Priestia aryabhattai]